MKDKIRPVLFVWTDEGVMRPVGRFKPMCDRQYIVGEEYVLSPHETVDMRTRGHFMASVAEAWKNLPEDIAPRFPTSEHLRKWALVQVGFASETLTVCDTPKDAKTMAALIRKHDEFAVITVSKNTVQTWVARTTANPIKREEFQEAKWAVLDLLASMVNVPRARLSKEGERTSGRPERVKHARFS